MKESQKNKSKNRYRNVFLFLIIFAFLIGLVALIIYFLNGTSKYTSTDKADTSVSSLSCTADNLAESFFDISETNSAKQDIKIAFNDNKISTIMYTLEAN